MKLARLIPLGFLLVPLLWGQGATAPAKTAEDYSGMYSFLQEGEFVQLTVEDQTRVTGFVSRYGDSESDRGVFLDQFFKSATLEGTSLTFITDTVHGVWYDFKGTIERGTGKSPADEAYHLLRGTLTEYRMGPDKKVNSKPRDVSLKSFPRDMETAPGKRD